MAIATAGAGLAGGAAKFFSGRAMQRKAQKFIDNFQWQDLQNPYENEQVSTLGAEYAQEQSNIGAASATEALRSGGSRGLANIGKIEAMRNDVARKNAINLDEQQKAINTRIAGQEVVNQNTIEKRQTDELAGYGQMLNTGMGMKWQGVDNAVNAVGAFGQSVGGQAVDAKMLAGLI